MNVLLKEVAQSLIELEMGLKGELTFSATMERLMEDLRMNRIPAVWSKVRAVKPSIKIPFALKLRIKLGGAVREWNARTDSMPCRYRSRLAGHSARG